jgi:hypothetical protein
MGGSLEASGSDVDISWKKFEWILVLTTCSLSYNAMIFEKKAQWNYG